MIVFIRNNSNMRFSIFFLISVATVSAEISGKKCTTDKDCRQRVPPGIRYYCDQKTCYARYIMASSPTDKSCNVHQDCYREVFGVKFHCDSSTKKCFSRPILEAQPTEHHCEKKKDCYRLLVGVEYYCRDETKTCGTRPIV